MVFAGWFPVFRLDLCKGAFLATVLAFLFPTTLLFLPGSLQAKPLESVDELKAELGNPHLVVIDIRSVIDGSTEETYAQAHIPGAIHSDYDKAGWRATNNGLPFMLPTVAQLEKLVGELGILEDSHVVVVPAGVSATDFGAAARAYWTLKVVGVENVSILDGGFAAWTAASYPVESGTVTPEPEIFTARINKSLIAHAADAEKLSTNGEGILIDARPSPYFEGKLKADNIGAYGHIPHSINIDSERFYNSQTNRLRNREELAAIAHGLPPSGPIITYCNTGHWSSTDWFVLSELLGRKDVTLYYGSMEDWSSVATRPISSSRTKWDDIKKFFGHGT